jgi:hypothetical protein
MEDPLLTSEEEINPESSSENDVPPQPSKPKYISYVPDKGSALIYLAKTVLAKLRIDMMGIIRFKLTEYETVLTDYTAAHEKTAEIKADKKKNARKLQDVDARCKGGLRSVKNYLDDIFGNEKTVHYSSFGILKDNNGGYIFPNSRLEKVYSLKQLIKAFDKYGFTDNRIGTSFWQGLLNEYDEYMPIATALSGEETKVSGIKKVLKPQLREYLTTVKKTIEANNPTTYKSVLREWGYQRETY